MCRAAKAEGTPEGHMPLRVRAGLGLASCCTLLRWPHTLQHGAGAEPQIRQRLVLRQGIDGRPLHVMHVGRVSTWR
jgi:hypothetical protein